LFLKLAEALAERSDCQNRIAEVNKRLARSARVQEGERPPEDPVALLAELDRLYVRLLELIQAINRTNARRVPQALGFLTLKNTIGCPIPLRSKGWDTKLSLPDSSRSAPLRSACGSAEKSFARLFAALCPGKPKAGLPGTP
jgi:hypothetical protein